MKLETTSVMKMHPLGKRQVNEEETLIGRLDVGEFVIFPTVAIDIIELLDQGNTVGEVEAAISEKMGEPVDVSEFVEDLVDTYRFVASVDSVVVNAPIMAKDHMGWISERVSKRFFHPVTYVLFGIVVASGLALMAVTQRYFPVYSDLFISSSTTGTLLAAILGGWLLTFIHEMAHLVGARSLGIGSRFGFSHRQVFAVAETNMSNIVLVEPKRRYRAYLAGMWCDLLIMSLNVWLLFLHDQAWLHLSVPLLSMCKLVNIMILMRLAFQFMFFMQTDLYYVCTTFLGCNNLLGNTKLFLKGLINRQTEQEAQEWSYVEEREKRIIQRVFAWFYVAGSLWGAWFFYHYHLKMMLALVSRVWNEVRYEPLVSLAFIDGIAVIVLLLVPFAILLYSLMRTWKRSRKKRVEPSATQS